MKPSNVSQSVEVQSHNQEVRSLSFISFSLIPHSSLTVKCPHQPISGLTISASCERNGRVFPCSGHLLPGTIATIRCQIGYQKLEGPISSELTCQEDGKWSQVAEKCQPISGSSISQSKGSIFFLHLFLTNLKFFFHSEVSSPANKRPQHQRFLQPPRSRAELHRRPVARH